MIGTLRRALRTLGGDTSGMALVEFALSLPILLLMYLGGYQVEDGIACNRKVTIATRAVADLTTQSATLAASDVTSILNASTQVLAPYDSTNALVRVSEIAIDANGKATIKWSQAIHGTARAKNASFTLPASIAVPNTYLIYSEVVYPYKPAVLYSVVGSLTLADAIYMSPRVSSQVACDDC